MKKIMFIILFFILYSFATEELQLKCCFFNDTKYVNFLCKPINDTILTYTEIVIWKDGSYLKIKNRYLDEHNIVTSYWWNLDTEGYIVRTIEEYDKFGVKIKKEKDNIDKKPVEYYNDIKNKITTFKQCGNKE